MATKPLTPQDPYDYQNIARQAMDQTRLQLEARRRVPVTAPLGPLGESMADDLRRLRTARANDQLFIGELQARLARTERELAEARQEVEALRAVLAGRARGGGRDSAARPAGHSAG